MLSTVFRDMFSVGKHRPNGAAEDEPILIALDEDTLSFLDISICKSYWDPDEEMRYSSLKSLIAVSDLYDIQSFKSYITSCRNITGIGRGVRAFEAFCCFAQHNNFLMAKKTIGKMWESDTDFSLNPLSHISRVQLTYDCPRAYLIAFVVAVQHVLVTFSRTSMDDRRWQSAASDFKLLS